MSYQHLTPETLEEVVKPRLRGLVHAWAILPMAVAGIVLVLLAPSTEARAGLAVYSLAITGMLAASASYHRLQVSELARRRLRRLDHSMIGVAVAGSYTPVVALVTTGLFQNTLLAILWAGAVGATLVSFFWPHASNALRAGFYMCLGWAGAAVIPWLWREGGTAAFALVFVGAVFYSLGALVYATHKPNPWPETFGFHEVFHAFVMCAVLAHFGAIALVVRHTA